MLGRVKSLLRSFQYAIRGIGYCVRSERNMRIHVVAAVYAGLLSLYYGLSAIEHLVLLLVITMVISAELINTAMEVVVNRQSPTYNDAARIAKDVAAGAVLICAAAAVCCGLVLFGDMEKLWGLFVWLATDPLRLVLTLLLVAGSILFIFLESHERAAVARNIKKRRKP